MRFEFNRMLTNEEAEKIYTKVLKKEETLEELSNRLGITLDEAVGLCELLSYFEYPIIIINEDDNIIIKKSRKQTYKNNKKVKPSMDECHKATIGIVSDTHLCSKEQQLHMLNTAYKYFYEKEISDVLHCGDLVDGDYAEKRKSQRYTRCMHGVKEQSDYVIEMYPKVSGINTRFIQGSHDETHKLNGGAILGEIVSKSRSDMIYEGQDYADVMINNVKIRMRHPGGGISKYKSRSIQNTIDSMQYGKKPKLLVEGHYHKSYYCMYRYVHGILVPSLCYQSQFMERKDIANIMGFYDVDIYSDEKGNIQYITPREHLFNEDEIKKDDWRKTKKLIIK